MSHIRASKQALKRERDALARFRRYLPTLQLKKQQLQLEVRRAEAEERACETEIETAWRGLESWISLIADDPPFSDYLSIESVEEGSANIAGVEVPVVEGIEFTRTLPDLHDTEPFLDDALGALRDLVRLRLELRALAERRTRLARELRVTAQRVNLFEKVKIPEAEQAIRTIRIALGDIQAAEVVRAKIAKGKAVELEVAQ